MRIMLALLILAGSITNAGAKELAHALPGGSVYVDGSKASKQVFVLENNKTYQLSHYAHWENIDGLFVSPDNHHLVVYHRADKAKQYQITLYDLKSRAAVASTAPGWACLDVKWFHNKILFISGATGVGTVVLAYNYRLKKLFDLQVGYLFIDTKNAICFRYPLYSADEGMFTLYDLDAGAKKASFDFNQKIKEGYIFDSAENTGDRTYKFVLWTLKTHKKVTVVKAFD